MEKQIKLIKNKIKSKESRKPKRMMFKKEYHASSYCYVMNPVQYKHYFLFVLRKNYFKHNIIGVKNKGENIFEKRLCSEPNSRLNYKRTLDIDLSLSQPGNSLL